ncbi:hypothetical protein [Variovorax sp. CF079]|uniref:hypothetical protein n=2 Tax=unclassified Variovorax TaxID=663243 RepID=UPI00111432A1|nr:hypothetical protein [Variovorax sp. CF079]
MPKIDELPEFPVQKTCASALLAPHLSLSQKEAAMENLDLETIEKARIAIEEVIAGRSLGVQAVPYFAPTDLGVLPSSQQEAELRLKEENDYGNRVRAGIHMSLSAAEAALRVAETLLRDAAYFTLSERKQELAKCANRARRASASASHAAAVLAGEEAPKTDAMMEIKRLGSAMFQRFGQVPEDKP